MKTPFLFALALIATTAQADQYVRPHVRSDGTVVNGYLRSSPNNNPYDNYSTRGNTNPYTQERGYTDPTPNLPTYTPSAPPSIDAINDPYSRLRD